jgi:hypothetical protein
MTTVSRASFGGSELKRRLSTVMPGFMPGIHVLVTSGKQGVDGRDKPGHDR